MVIQPFFYGSLLLSVASDTKEILKSTNEMLDKYGYERTMFLMILVFIIALLVFAICKQETVFRIKATLAKGAKAIFRGLKKTQVRNEIRSDILSASRKLSRHSSDIFPMMLSIDFVKTSKKETFISDGRVIVRMSDTKNREKNFIIAATEFVKKGFLPHAKQGFYPNLQKATDAVVIRKLISNSKGMGLGYFLAEFYPKYIQSDDRINRLYNDLLDVDNNGIFISVLARQAALNCARVPFIETSIAFKNDIKDLTAMLIEIAKRDQSDNTKLIMNGTYIKVFFILATTIDSPANIADKAELIKNKVDAGIHSIYILALGTKIPSGREIAEKAYSIDNRFSAPPRETNYKKVFDDGETISGVCIELLTHVNDQSEILEDVCVL